MIAVSQGSRKMKGMRSINTTPLSNEYCIRMSKVKGSVCSACYSMRMVKGVYAKVCQPVWHNNGVLLSKGLVRNEDMPIIKNDIFRFHSHGELINDIHYTNYVRIAERNPNTRFVLWTKRTDIVKAYIRTLGHMPSNLKLIYSSPIMNKRAKVDMHIYDKVFTVYTEQYAKAHKVKINCGGKMCVDCRVCYSDNHVKYINELPKKYGRKAGHK